MPTQLQLEGPELEPLLARVRAEHGSAARIVQAEKVRTGGVGGFFAKARFEITVEVDDPVTPAPSRPTSILDLADEVSAVERTAAAVSTESTGFAAVLARLGATAGEPGEARPTTYVPQQRSAPPAESAPTPAPERTSAPRPAATRVPPRRAAAPARQAPQPGTAVALRSVVARPRVDVVAAPGRSVAARPRADVVAAPGRRVVAAPGRAVAVRQPAAAAPSSPARLPGGKAVARTTSALQAAARPVPERRDVHEQLAGLGLPAQLRPECLAQGVHAALVRRMRDLPKAPRTATRAGSVIAVVGPQPLAQEVARQMAEELGLPRTAVVLAGRGRAAGTLRSGDEIRRRRLQWAKRSHATLVVIDTPLTAAGALWTRELLDAVQPSSTWGVVEATRKPRDVGAWTQAVGRIDALAVTAVDETADPAAVLELGIPVGRLGARKATPAAWASLLADRIAA